MDWNLITNIILGGALVILGGMGILGLKQWVERKSLKKVDPQLTSAIVPLGLMAMVYFIFDKIIVLNTRPNGSGESSFPSTHVMVVATVFFIVMIGLLPEYIKSKRVRVALDLVMVGLIILTCVGRVLANMHWVSDVIGGVGFAVGFAVIYGLILRRMERARRLEQK